MIRALVLRYGRPTTWAILITTGALVLVFVFGANWLLQVVTDTPDPADVLAAGGHVVTVAAYCDGGGWLAGGTYEVITRSGPEPGIPRAELAEGRAQIVVAPDWIGQVRMVKKSWLAPDYNELTDWIGGPFGWGDQTVSGTCS